MIKWNNKTLNQLETIQKNALIKTWMYLENKVKQDIKKTSYDTWDLLRSINTRLVRKDYVRVGTNRIQAWIMEYWRKPWTFPNLNALVGWAWRHWFHKWWITKSYNELDSKSRGKVYVLARSIKDNWIEARRPFRNTYDKENKKLIKIYQKYLQDYIKKWI